VKVGAHQVPAFLRKEDQVAGLGRHHLAAFGEPHLARAFGEEVEERDVIGAGEARAHRRDAELAANAPGRGELPIQVAGAGEAHRLQNVRQGIHGVSVKYRGVPAKARHRCVRILAPSKRERGFQ
jgi:hypothetical protein